MGVTRAVTRVAKGTPNRFCGKKWFNKEKKWFNMV